MSALDDPAAGDLRRRLASAVRDASAILDLPDPDAEQHAPSVDAGGIATLREALEEREGGAGGAAHAAELDRLRERYEARFEALRGAERAVERLRATTAPADILQRAPRELCAESTLERALLSVVRDGMMVAEAAYFRDDEAGAANALAELAAAPARLEHPLIETEILRRRRATIVTHAQRHPRVHRPTAAIMGWRGYVAAPLVVLGDVIGVIHADAGRDGRQLDVLDGDVLWTFARGLADVYETTMLRRSLRRQRDEMRQFLDWLGARSSEIADASIDLAAERGPAPGPPGGLGLVAAGADADDRRVFEDLLTRRELVVLRLLVRGATNRAIAAQLVISQATVKFHVRNVLAKLRVANRAEAVARYHQLVRTRPGPR